MASKAPNPDAGKRPTKSPRATLLPEQAEKIAVAKPASPRSRSPVAPTSQSASATPMPRTPSPSTGGKPQENKLKPKNRSDPAKFWEEDEYKELILPRFYRSTREPLYFDRRYPKYPQPGTEEFLEFQRQKEMPPENLDSPPEEQGDSKAKEKKPTDEELEKACSKLLKPSSLNTEFLYYATALKEFVWLMSHRNDRFRVVNWIKKLYMPEYFGPSHIQERNRYMLQLTLSCINDETYGVFGTDPPNQINLKSLSEWCPGTLPPARWERNKLWDELLTVALGEVECFNDVKLDCNVHGEDCKGTENEPENVKAVGKLLDEEFQFFLYIIQPYLPLIENSKDRRRVAAWLQHLSRAHRCACCEMKGIRNDYMQALIGYVQDMNIAGIFENPPEEGSNELLPLAKAADDLKPNNKIFASPTSDETESFLATQPKPTNGAFCYIAISGEMEDFITTKPISKQKSPFTG